MSLIDAFERITPSPPGYQVWIDESRARGILHCGEDELRDLQEAGLATSGDLVERYDVWNLGFAEGAQRSRGEREMLFFNRLLRSYGSDWISPYQYEMTATTLCPRGALCESTGWPDPDIPGATWTDRQAGGGEAQWRGSITMQGRAGEVVSPVVRALWDELLETYGFQFTTSALAAETELTRQRRVGDCAALSKVLALDLRSAGLDAHVRSGYIFGGARTRWHRWVEVVDEDGATKALDSAMAMIADTFFTPQYKAFCFGSRLNRIIPLDDVEQFYVSHECGSEVHRTYVDVRLRPA
ncbi:transglutaminase domain-containing protein [Cellulomonas sp. URHB0016]